MWMSCLLAYRVGFRRTIDDDWTATWMTDEGTHRDLRSDKLFFFEEPEGTNHSLTIRNLDFETNYEVVVAVLNPFGRMRREEVHVVSTAPGSCIKEKSHHKFQLKPCRAMPGWVRA